jgi:hypothetical protein
MNAAYTQTTVAPIAIDREAKSLGVRPGRVSKRAAALRARVVCSWCGHKPVGPREKESPACALK